jgi:hypothetical protein
MRRVITPASQRWLVVVFLAAAALLLSACQPGKAAAALPLLEATETATPTSLTIIQEPSETFLPTASPSSLAETPQTALVVAATLSPTPPELHPLTPTPTSALVDAIHLSEDEWQTWPVIPQVPENARLLYQKGLTLGNNPHAFSIIGDCQSMPETFLGVYDTDPTVVAKLPPELQAAVANFSGSFNRLSPTVKPGTTAGAALWSEWHENKYTCTPNETPLDCELRLNKPSIVIINLGTHYETRNIVYLRKILDRLTGQGIVPILATKADNRELDGRLNQEMAELALEYSVPLWNFYAAVSDLPNHGVGVKKGEEFLGEIYLNEEGLERHRYTALEALTAVWLAVK